MAEIVIKTTPTLGTSDNDSIAWESAVTEAGVFVCPRRPRRRLPPT